MEDVAYSRRESDFLIYVLIDGVLPELLKWGFKRSSFIVLNSNSGKTQGRGCWFKEPLRPTSI